MRKRQVRCLQEIERVDDGEEGPYKKATLHLPIHIYIRRSHRGLEVCEAICRRGRMGADLWQAVWALPSTKINPLDFCSQPLWWRRIRSKLHARA